ncbi:cysteine-rich receptor-like protein kinase 29 isoform X2 [Prosopis cineraria]|uniref:cysteine-rich receptor-like protein kinase 29 isoform X2 n=1 Tax=Prosopis cineraria TaxID=364024 RepID=UPI00240EBABE|nr:cysteine-rich receptor-like protein kinase 29 isoform X2 [Prosopis cineraria]
MEISTISFTLLPLLSHLPFLIVGPPDFRCSHCVDSKGHYTSTSTFQANLNILLSHLTSDAKINNCGFIDISHGENPDRVNAIGLCRGGVTQDERQSCLRNASIILPKLSPIQKEAMGSSGECTLRYSNYSVSQVLESDSLLRLVSHCLFYDPVTDGSPKPYSPSSQDHRSCY